MSKYLKDSYHAPLDPDEDKETRAELNQFMAEELEPAELLRQLRVQKGWTQKQLAEKLKIPHEEMVKMERGERIIDKKTARLLAKIFHMDEEVFRAA